jgi:hypothetical protein
MPEFTVTLRDNSCWDIFIDGELQYFDLTDIELSEFARDFRASNPEYLAPAAVGE